MSNVRKMSLQLVTVVMLVYIGTYVILSSAGQYVPGSWWLGWVKHYIWAPHGFVAGPAGIEQRRLPQMLFLPLWWVDMRFVHSSSKAGDDQYPINTLLDEELQKRLKAYEQNPGELSQRHRGPAASAPGIPFRGPKGDD